MTDNELEFWEDLLGEKLNPNESGECLISCPLPAHVDSNPSFSLNIEKELWICHGCGKSGHLNSLEYQITGKKPLVASYEYTDESGKLLFTIHRYRPKSFSAEKPDGTKNLRDVRFVLYHLSDVIGAPTVFLVEGEKDCDRLRECGLKDKNGHPVAVTTNPFGAGKFRKEYAPYFKDKDLVIFSDADTRGLKHSAAAAKLLTPYAKQVKRITEYLDEVKDVSEFLDLHPVTDLEKAIAEAELYENSSEKNAYECDLVPLLSIEPEETKFLVIPHIVSGSINFIDGDPNCGKTYFALALSALITSGREITSAISGKEQSVEPRNVIFFSSEDSASKTLRPRAQRLKADLSRLYILDLDDFKKKPLTLDQTDRIESYLKELTPALLIFDPLQSFLGSSVDLYRPNETRPIFAGLGALAEKYDCTILFVRHLTKCSVNANSIYRGMGGMDLPGIARSILLVCNDPDNHETKIACHVKHNLSKRGKSIRYSISDGNFSWLGYCELTPEDISAAMVAATRPVGMLDRAKDWLLDILSNGPIPATEIFENADKEGYKVRTINRAKQELGIQSRPKGFQQPHMWELPTLPPSESLATCVSLGLSGVTSEDEPTTI